MGVWKKVAASLVSRPPRLSSFLPPVNRRIAEYLSLVLTFYSPFLPGVRFILNSGRLRPRGIIVKESRPYFYEFPRPLQ